MQLSNRSDTHMILTDGLLLMTSNVRHNSYLCANRSPGFIRQRYKDITFYGKTRIKI